MENVDTLVFYFVNQLFKKMKRSKNRRTSKHIYLLPWGLFKNEQKQASTDGKLPFDLCDYTTYVPFPWKEMRDREIFGWFLRMSEAQIMDSDLAVKYLLEKSLKA
jgi:hypothetical protein